jgi:Ca2+-binding EF-hand superfamily protein
MFASLGKIVPDAEIEAMIREAPGDLNFTSKKILEIEKKNQNLIFLVFLTLFGEKLTGSDPEDVIRNAFLALDEEGTGKITEERLRELLTSMGDRYTEEEVDEFFKDAPIKNGVFDYQEFVKILKYGRKDED